MIKSNLMHGLPLLPRNKGLLFGADFLHKPAKNPLNQNHLAIEKLRLILIFMCKEKT